MPAPLALRIFNFKDIRLDRSLKLILRVRNETIITFGKRAIKLRVAQVRNNRGIYNVSHTLIGPDWPPIK